MYGIRANRSASSVMGAGSAWLGERTGNRFEVDTIEEAYKEAKRLNDETLSQNVWYAAERIT